MCLDGNVMLVVENESVEMNVCVYWQQEEGKEQRETKTKEARTGSGSSTADTTGGLEKERRGLTRSWQEGRRGATRQAPGTSTGHPYRPLVGGGALVVVLLLLVNGRGDLELTRVPESIANSEAGECERSRDKHTGSTAMRKSRKLVSEGSSCLITFGLGGPSPLNPVSLSALLSQEPPKSLPNAHLPAAHSLPIPCLAITSNL